MAGIVGAFILLSMAPAVNATSGTQTKSYPYGTISTSYWTNSVKGGLIIAWTSSANWASTWQCNGQLKCGFLGATNPGSGQAPCKIYPNHGFTCEYTVTSTATYAFPILDCTITEIGPVCWLELIPVQYSMSITVTIVAGI